MTDSERMASIESDFEKLKRNREKIPLQKLQTTYAKSYYTLSETLTRGADWYADQYLTLLVDNWPRHEKDTGGNEWMDRKVAAIIEEENQPGGLRDRWRKALIIDLDWPQFVQLIYERYARCEREAFDPYWQRHNKWVGEPGKRWIFNDIIQRFWLPPGKDDHWPNGAWIDSKYNVYNTNWPPAIGDDKE